MPAAARRGWRSDPRCGVTATYPIVYRGVIVMVCRIHATTYRLAPNIAGVRNRHDNTSDPEVTLPAFIFQDAYELVATEGKDTNNPHDPPTKIGTASRYIIHPDHHHTSSRKDHKDHIHMQVGPTYGGFLAPG